MRALGAGLLRPRSPERRWVGRALAANTAALGFGPLALVAPHFDPGLLGVAIVLGYVYGPMFAWARYCARHSPFRFDPPLSAPRRWVHEGLAVALIVGMALILMGTDVWRLREAAGGAVLEVVNASLPVSPTAGVGRVLFVGDDALLPASHSAAPFYLDSEFVAPLAGDWWAVGEPAALRSALGGGLLLAGDQELCEDKTGAAGALCVRWLDWGVWAPRVRREWLLNWLACWLSTVFGFTLMVDAFNLLVGVVALLSAIVVVPWAWGCRRRAVVPPAGPGRPGAGRPRRPAPPAMRRARPAAVVRAPPPQGVSAGGVALTVC